MADSLAWRIETLYMMPLARAETEAASVCGADKGVDTRRQIWYQDAHLRIAFAAGNSYSLHQ